MVTDKKIPIYYDTPEETRIFNQKIKEAEKAVMSKAIFAGIISLIFTIILVVWLFGVGENFFAIIFIVVGLFFTILIPNLILEKAGQYYRSEMVKNKVTKLQKYVELGHVSEYPSINEIFNKDYINYIPDSKIQISQALCRGIEKRLFSNSRELQKYLQNTPVKNVDQKGNVTYSDFDCFAIEKNIKNASMKATDNFVVESGLTDYQFVEVTRSTNKDIGEETYIFAFDDDDNLKLLKPPYVIYQNIMGETVMIYDKNNESKPITINKGDIKDFQLFGTQLMESTVSSEGPLKQKPGLVKTVFSELVFGTAYTIMKNLNTAGVNTKHSVNDMRIVQLILKDKTDIELKGVSIYYEFNRRMGSVKNKENNLQRDKVINEPVKSKNTINTSYIEELKNLKELFDMDVITKEEFDLKKKKILDKNS